MVEIAAIIVMIMEMISNGMLSGLTLIAVRISIFNSFVKLIFIFFNLAFKKIVSKIMMSFIISILVFFVF